MEFFKVALVGEPSVETFRALTATHRGDFTACNPFDGAEHGFMELGAWIGDQGLALQYMALGVLLKQFTLLSPKTLMPQLPELHLELAQSGYITVQMAS